MQSLLNELPVNTLGYPLGTFWKLFVYFLLPSSITLVLYLLLILCDFALVFVHISEGNPRWGTATLLFMFSPSVAGFIFTLSSVDRWPSYNPLAKENLRFLGLNLWHLLGFPFAALYRYIHQVFWSVEAMCANHVEDHDRRENAMRIFMKPNSMELYFFLQAYLHSAPQIFLQFYILFNETSSDPEIASLQVMSIVASLFRMAITTMAYQRFERRKVLGVYYPWTSKRMLDVSKRFSEIDTNRYQETVSEIKPGYEEPTSPVRTLALIEESFDESNDDEVFEEPIPVARSPVPDAFSHLDTHRVDVQSDGEGLSQLSSGSSGVFEDEDSPDNNSPVQFRKNAYDSDHDDDLLKDKVTDMRKHVTPPSDVAPRPMSIAVIRERLVSNAISLINEIPHRKYKEQDDIDLPVRIRRTAIKGVEQEDGVSKLIAFFAWFLFIMSRMLVLCTFCYFYVYPLIYFCVAHYTATVALLLWNSWSENLYRKFFYLFLGYVYIFCIIELKMRFKKVRLWYGLYFAVITLENFILTVVWFNHGEVAGWWYGYILLATFVTYMLSFMCFLIYFMILKPKPVIVYPNIPSESVFPATIS